MQIKMNVQLSQAQQQLTLLQAAYQDELKAMINNLMESVQRGKLEPGLEPVPLMRTFQEVRISASLRSEHTLEPSVGTTRSVRAAYRRTSPPERPICVASGYFSVAPFA
jgi:hypothetical protein